MTSAIPEAGRQAAHILLDTVIAFDDELGEDDANSAAMDLALQRLNDVDAVTATIDDETDVVDMNITNLVGGAVVTMKLLAGVLAEAKGISIEEVVSTTRRFLDGDLDED